MVRWPAAIAASSYARSRQELSVGLHVDLEEWNWVSHCGWLLNYQVVRDESEIEGEIRAQLETFRRLVGRAPTHLDSHQHVHELEPAAAVMRLLAGELGVPLRGISAVRYRGDFYGLFDDGSPNHEALTPRQLISIIRSLGPGITELGCHPGVGPDLPGDYRCERELELRTLCDPSVLAAIRAEDVRLRPFESTLVTA